MKTQTVRQTMSHAKFRSTTTCLKKSDALIEAPNESCCFLSLICNACSPLLCHLHLVILKRLYQSMISPKLGVYDFKIKQKKDKHPLNARQQFVFLSSSSFSNQMLNVHSFGRPTEPRTTGFSSRLDLFGLLAVAKLLNAADIRGGDA
ncbi:hypothetical protein T02_13545 [Trichinella nativa]|uniref:Uncharacterized protein n=1 Tax=Trichinella nativa TaxID=6335 RepID=A0A0V1KTC2_9BILA|nr:hypothetical protein T02_13545 [Trichinella nativa]